MAEKERRAFPRIRDEGLSLKVKVGDFDAITHTLNLSASGVYCKVDKEMPLMARVKLVLMVPDMSRDDDKGYKDKGYKSLDVEGVVVREHPVIIDGEIRHYDVAIFFDSLSAKDREIIESYISRKRT